MKFCIFVIMSVLLISSQAYAMEAGEHIAIMEYADLQKTVEGKTAEQVLTDLEQGAQTKASLEGKINITSHVIAEFLMANGGDQNKSTESWVKQIKEIPTTKYHEFAQKLLKAEGHTKKGQRQKETAKVAIEVITYLNAQAEQKLDSAHLNLRTKNILLIASGILTVAGGITSIILGVQN